MYTCGFLLYIPVQRCVKLHCHILRFFLTILFSLKETSYFHFTKNYF